jgi:DNA-binding transcriptional ArsR family regulator
MTKTMAMQRLTDFFKALGNEKRQEMLLALFARGGEHTPNEVAGKLGIAQSTASEHLAFLKRGGLLISRKEGKEVLYSLDSDGIIAMLDEVKRMLNCCR